MRVWELIEYLKRLEAAQDAEVVLHIKTSKGYPSLNVADLEDLRVRTDIGPGRQVWLEGQV